VVLAGCNPDRSGAVSDEVYTEGDASDFDGNVVSADNPGVDQAPPNVIAIQLEAFQTFVLNRSIQGIEITPRLNELIRESAYFPNFYLQNGGGSTSDAEFMMNTSLHPFKYPQSVAVDASDKRFDSLPRLLRPLGYTSTTLHTNHIMFWNRKNFYSALGFDSYYDKTYFGLKDVIASGSSDQVLFEKGMDVLKTLKQPFYAQFITMSGHYPFSIPNKLKSMDLPDVYEGNLVGHYLHAARYVDETIGDFIDALRSNGLWDNTVLVLYGDHSGLQMKFVKEKESAALKELLGRAYDKIDALQVPLIIHGNGAKVGEHSIAGGHLDILPTLLPLLGLEMRTPFFGVDLFTEADHPVAVRSSFAEEGTFVYKDVLFDAADASLLSLKTRERPEEVPFDASEVKQRLLQQFQTSDDLIRALPTKNDSFGIRVLLTEPSDVYATPDERRPAVGSLAEGTEIVAYRSQGDWYSFSGEDGAEAWVRTFHPIQEVFKLLYLPGKAKLFPEPDESSKPRLEIGKQTLYVLAEWKDTGWYQVSTSFGEELWVQVK
ncbi:MAG TPA: LTA synthase family protein, partial [Paenibacillus sp.]|nr:LTA synthase family protein [Paenibacillus sp.]